MGYLVWDLQRAWMPVAAEVDGDRLDCWPQPGWRMTLLLAAATRAWWPGQP